MFFLVSGQIFSGHLRMALPILGVNRLGEGTEFMEGVMFANVGDLILDAGWKSMIQLSAEGGIAPLDMGGEVVEVDEVLHNALVIVHLEIFKVCLGPLGEVSSYHICYTSSILFLSHLQHPSIRPCSPCLTLHPYVPPLH